MKDLGEDHQEHNQQHNIHHNNGNDVLRVSRDLRPTAAPGAVVARGVCTAIHVLLLTDTFLHIQEFSLGVPLHLARSPFTRTLGLRLHSNVESYFVVVGYETKVSSVY